MVFFEAPHRTHAALMALAQAFGAERRGAVCRELTKTYEEIKRGSLEDLAAWAAEEVRGEVTLVVEGAPEQVAAIEDVRAAVAELEADGLSRRDAIARVAAESGLPKRQVYDEAHK